MNRTIISIGDKIFFEGRKTPFRVCRHGHLNGEAAVDLIRPSDWTAFRRRGQAHVARTMRSPISCAARVAGGRGGVS